MIARITARRAALAQQLAQAQQQYDQLDATLRTLDRQLCAMAGGLQELDALLVDRDQDDDHNQQRGIGGTDQQ